jgi:putative membrane protein
MMALLIRWLITAVAVMGVPYLVSGVRLEGIGSILMAAAVLGILNALVRPVLVFLTLPLTIFTLGFFILIINALLFQLAAAVVPGMQVDSFWSAFFASIIVSIVSWIVSSVVSGKRRETIIVHKSDTVVDMHRRSDGKWD